MSSLRGSLMAADGAVIDSVAKPWGIQHLPRGILTNHPQSEHCA